MGALAALLQVLFPEVDELDEALELELELDALELDELELLDETLELLELLTELELLDDTLELLELDEELKLIELLEVNPTVRSTALMFALARSREVLEQVVSSMPPETPITISAADLLVLTRAAMARLR